MAYKSIEDIEGIAVIGMSCRFPNSNNIDEYWHNLINKKECITFFDGRNIDHSINPNLLKDPNYIKCRGIIDDIEMFDASLFDISPLEAKIMDPQQRIFLQLAKQCLYNGGYLKEHDFRIGVFAGAGNNTYLKNHVSNYPDQIDLFSDFQTMLVNEKDYLTTKTSFKLNLSGPSININTACSTSLVAVNYGVDSLLNYQCDMALAGGISLVTPQNSGYLYKDGAINSKDGHCRPFDIDASGTVFGNGGGLVLLKRLEDAINDNDHIFAVIKGSSVNNDGSDKMTFTAPSINGQSEVIAEALSNGEIDPETISYIEAHGTGTKVGDPIEIEGLKKGFNTSKSQFCHVGSVKGNIGHLDSAAGIASLIKTALMLKNRILVPSINFNKPNPEINFKSSPFKVITETQPWETINNIPRRAGISSFGVGGTNAHCILEESPIPIIKNTNKKFFLYPVSSHDATSLDKHQEKLSEFLQKCTEQESLDISNTLISNSQDSSFRTFILQNHISSKVNSNSKTYEYKKYRKCVFMFSGQGSQYLNMAKDLYFTDEYIFQSTFKEHLDSCFNIYKDEFNIDLKSILFSDEDIEKKLDNTEFTQPLLFTIETGIAKILLSLGIKPSALIGHSIGEYSAAYIADVFSLKDAIKIVSMRGKLMQSAPKGAMVAIHLPEKDIWPLLNNDLTISIKNTPNSYVVSGCTNTINDLVNTLVSKNINHTKLHTSHAFHSSMMDPILVEFSDYLKDISFRAPTIPLISNVTGTYTDKNAICSPEYWVKQLRDQVYFSDGIETLLKEFNIFIECGPSTTLSTVVKQIAQSKHIENVCSLPTIKHPKATDNDLSFFLSTIGSLWSFGLDFDLKIIFNDEEPNKISLPDYSFNNKRFWFDTIPFSKDQLNPKINLEKSKNQSSLETFIINNNDENLSSGEQVVASIWKQVLGIKKVSADDMFFDIGGDSLLVQQVITLFDRNYNISVSPNTLLLSNLRQIAKQHFSNLNDKSTTKDNVSKSKTALIPSLLNSSIGDIYNIVHKTTKNSTKGVIFCQSLGHEYIRAHKVICSLANDFSKLGYHSIRFDYFGTGDSTGLNEEINLKSCIDSFSEVLKEFISNYYLNEIIIIGNRFGSLIPLLTDLDKFNDIISNLILWDPLLNGQDYLNEIRNAHIERLGKQKSINELIGFKYSTDFINEIRDIEINSLDSNIVSIVQSKNTSFSTNNRLFENINILKVNDECFWSSGRNSDQFIISKEINNSISNLVKGIYSNE